MIPASLKTEAELGRRLLDSIAEALNGDEDLRADTVEGETAFMEALDRTHDRIKAIEAVAQSDEDRAADLKARAERRRSAVDADEGLRPGRRVRVRSADAPLVLRDRGERPPYAPPPPRS